MAAADLMRSSDSIQEAANPLYASRLDAPQLPPVPVFNTTQNSSSHFSSSGMYVAFPIFVGQVEAGSWSPDCYPGSSPCI